MPRFIVVFCTHITPQQGLDWFPGFEGLNSRSHVRFLAVHACLEMRVGSWVRPWCGRAQKENFMIHSTWLTSMEGNRGGRLGDGFGQQLPDSSSNSLVILSLYDLMSLVLESQTSRFGNRTQCFLVPN